MFGDCHIHMILDGIYYRDAIDAHKGHVCDELIRAVLERYARAGIRYLRDGGDAFGVCQRARILAAEYGIEYRIPCFPICMKGRYGGFIGRTFETMADYRALVAEVDRNGGDFIKIMISGLMDFDRYGRSRRPSTARTRFSLRSKPAWTVWSTAPTWMSPLCAHWPRAARFGCRRCPL